MSGTGYAVLGAILFFVLLFGVIWLAMRSAKHEGILQASNDTLKDGAAKDAKVQEILSEPVPSPAAVIERMRDNGF